MIGIKGLAVELPGQRVSAEMMAMQAGVSKEEVINETGVLEKPVLGADEDLMNYALSAAQRALTRSEIAAAEIDVIIFAGMGPWPKIHWSPASKLGSLLGSKAFCFEIQNGCHSGVLALNMAKQFLSGMAHLNNVLVVTADALARSVDYSAKQVELFCMADATAAVLVSRFPSKFKILETSFATQSEFVDEIWAERADAIWKTNDSPENDKKLSEAYRYQYNFQIRTALERSGKSLQDVKHVFMNQGDCRLIGRLSESLQLPREYFEVTYPQFGHLGSADVFWGFSRRIENAQIKSGDVMVLAASAVGFSWGACIVEAL